MPTRITGLVVAAAAGVTGLALIGSPAFADTTSTPTPSPTPSSTAKAHTPRTLAEVQATGAKATSDRETKLSAAITKATGDTSLSSSDRSTILGTLNADLAAMKSSASAIAADTTITQATTDLKAVYSKYRVYAVALPQARLASDADRLTGTALPKLTKEQSTLAGLLSGKDKAKSTAALQSDLSDMSAQIAQIATASHDASGQASAALAVTPSAYDSNHSALSSVKSSLESARTAAKKAASDAKTIRQALK